MKTKNIIIIIFLILLFNFLPAMSQTKEEWNKKGYDLFGQGKYEEAIKCYDKTLSIDPDNIIALCNKGGALVNLGRNEESIKYCDKALSLNPDIGMCWSNKGGALVNLGKNEEAINCCDKALALNPDIAEAWSNKGRALVNLGKNEEVINCCDKALSLNPNIAIAWSSKGVALVKSGKNEEAMKCCDKAISLNSKNILVLNDKGFVLLYIGEYKEAIEWTVKILEMKPENKLENLKAWGVIGLAQYGLEKYEEAIWAYDRALAIEPDYPPILEARKLALDALGENKEILWVPQKYFDYITNTSNLYYTSINLERTADEKFYKVKILTGQESLPVFWVANIAEIDFSNYQQGFTKNDINYLSNLNNYTRPAGGVSETCNFSGNYSSFGQVLQFLDFVGKINDLLNDMSGSKFSNDINYVYIPADREGAYIVRIYNGASMNVPGDERELIKSLPRGSELSMQAYAGNIILIIYDICDLIMSFDDLQKKVEKAGININKIFYKTIKDATEIEKLKETSKEGIVNIAKQYCLLFIDNLKLEFENSVLDKVVKEWKFINSLFPRVTRYALRVTI
jgi:tetratricopeptide (TPR) repeat protein